MGIHQHENYGLGKHGDGEYFCLQCGDILPSKFKVADTELPIHRDLAPDWPFGGDKTPRNRF